MLPFSGESVELVHDIALAGDLVVRLVEEAEAAVRRAAVTIAG